LNVLQRTQSDDTYIPGADSLSSTAADTLFFNVIDLNKDSSISIPEINEFATALGVVITPTEISELFGYCGASTGLSLSQFECVVTVAALSGTHFIPTYVSKSTEDARQIVALASGAQIVSTDYPVPPFVGASRATYYWQDITGGTPCRCNPITSLPGCTSTAIENLHPAATTAASTTGVVASTTGVAATTGVPSATTGVAAGTTSVVAGTTGVAAGTTGAVASSTSSTSATTTTRSTSATTTTRGTSTSSSGHATSSGNSVHTDVVFSFLTVAALGLFL